MKTLYTTLLAILVSTTTFSQNLIINGSFETNTATSNTLDITSAWAATVANSFEVDGGTMDLISSNGCGTASDGNWYVTTSPSTGLWPYLALSLKLNTTLVAGAQYVLSFDKRYCGPNTSPIDIGISTDSSAIGTAVHTFAAPTTTTWATETYTFQSPIAANFLTVNIGTFGSTGTVGVDNFILTSSVGMSETNLENEISVSPNPSNNGIFHFNNLGTTSSTICIYNILGEKVFETTTFSNNSSIELKQAKGIYFYSIENKNGKTNRGKLVVE